LYYVDNNQDYRDPHNPYTFVFVNPAALNPQMMQPQMAQPQLMQPQMMYPQMSPQVLPQMGVPNTATGVPGAFANPPTPSGATLLPMAEDLAGLTGGAGGAEESYIENILRFNRGKVGTFYMTFENNNQWNARVFRGRVETAGRDHIILSDPQTGKRYVLLMINLDWMEFDEPLAYIPPTVPANIQLTTGGAGVGAGPGTAGSRDDE